MKKRPQIIKDLIRNLGLTLEDATRIHSRVGKVSSRRVRKRREEKRQLLPPPRPEWDYSRKKKA